MKGEIMLTPSLMSKKNQLLCFRTSETGASDKNTSRDSPDEKQKKNEQQLNELMNAKKRYEAQIDRGVVCQIEH